MCVNRKKKKPFERMIRGLHLGDLAYEEGNYSPKPINYEDIDEVD